MASLEAPAVDAFFGPPTLRLIREAAWAALVTRYTNYAAITVIAWDMLLTFSAEVELIWSSRIGLLKIIYLFNRYVTPVVLGVNIWIMSGNAKGLTDTVCQAHLVILQLD
ncbi:hypothetical protein FRC17_001113 [Serendipita sp. 399]|nr:hypothetical protein FRC17_001113 [Serendipita sp. 399]